MQMNRIPLRFVVTVGAAIVLIGVAALLLSSDSRALQFTGGIFAASLIVLWLTGQVLEARRMELHVEKNPGLLKNDAIGEEVTAVGVFLFDNGTSKGVVLLNGEKWRAHCTGGPAPGPGDRLSVRGREGLTLQVEWHEFGM